MFPVYESKIGVSLRKIAKKSMKEANIYEVRIQLESENKDFETWKNCEKEQVKLTVSFDMG